MEDAANAVGSNAYAMVAHADTGKIALGLDQDFNRTALGTELDSVRHEVSDHRLQHVVVGPHHQRPTALILQFDVLRHGNHLEDVYHARDDVVQVEVLRHHVQAARLALGPLQQVVEQVVYIL